MNPIKLMILEKESNERHRTIADFEKLADVTVITQNGDDFT